MTPSPRAMQPNLSGILSTGRYLKPTNLISVTVASLSTGFERFVMFVVPKTITVDRIGAEVTSAGTAGAVVRLGIRNAAVDGLPGTLLLDAGTIDGTSATFQEITISQVLVPGIYWAVGCTQVAASTVRCISSGLILPSLSNAGPPTLEVPIGYRDSGGVVGGFAAAVGTLAVSASQVPVVVLRVV